MPKLIAKEGIIVVRNGKRVRPEIGKAFDFTKDEVEQLMSVRPSAIAELPKVEESKGEETGKAKTKKADDKGTEKVDGKGTKKADDKKPEGGNPSDEL